MEELQNDEDKAYERADISAADATCRVLVIPTNEELMIALDTLDIVEKG